jgi:hypothetical protein
MLLAFNGLGWGQDKPEATRTPDLAAPILLTAVGKPIIAEDGHAAPMMCDIDGDGKLDMLVGQMKEGRLRVYRNVGTHIRPEFSEVKDLQAGGKRLSLPAG